MNFGFNEEQDLLRTEVRKFVAGQCPMEEVRKLMVTDEGYSPALWQQLVELGVTGLIVPEEFGGAGLGLLDLVVVLEETGRGLFPSPLVSCALAASAIVQAGSDAQKKQYLPRIAEGAVATLAVFEKSDRLDESGIQLAATREGQELVLHGTKSFVGDAGTAELFVVAFRTDRGVSLAVLEASDTVRGESFKTMDRTKRAGNLVLEGARVSADALLGAEGEAWPTVATLLDRGAVMVTAEGVGAAEAAHAMTVEYAKTRVQFEHVIGKYQAVKHPLAEMFVDLESIKSLNYYAAWTAEHRPEELPLSASRAKAYIADAFVRVGIDSIQLHGAIGYTAELDAQLFMKRAKWTRPAFGDADVHYERIARLGA